MKTILEAAQEFGMAVGDGTGNIDFANIALDGFEAGVKFAQQWISVEDGKEKWYDTNNILLKDENGRVWTYNEYCEERPIVVITHWRPIELE